MQERSYSSAMFLEIPSFQNAWKKKIWFSVQCRGPRLVCKKGVEALSNHKKFYWWFGNPACCDSTFSSRTEKDQAHTPPRLVWGKKEEREVWFSVCVKCLWMIGLMVVMLISFSRAVSMVLVLWRVGPGNCVGFTDKNHVGLFQGSEMSAGWYSRNLILVCCRKATLTAHLWPMWMQPQRSKFVFSHRGDGVGGRDRIYIGLLIFILWTFC